MSKTTKETETEATAEAPKIDRTKLEQVHFKRHVKDIPYIGIVYTKVSEFCDVAREEEPKIADWTNDEIMENILSRYQAGNHVRPGQAHYNSATLVAGMKLDYVKIEGSKATKWGHLAKYIAQIKSELKSMGIEEPTDEQLRIAAEDEHATREARNEKRRQLLGL
jgi:hypothetical protein